MLQTDQEMQPIPFWTDFTMDLKCVPVLRQWSEARGSYLCDHGYCDQVEDRDADSSKYDRSYFVFP